LGIGYGIVGYSVRIVKPDAAQRNFRGILFHLKFSSARLI
jgi:hypothetical protein